MVELTCMKASSLRETEQDVKNESSKSKGWWGIKSKENINWS
jgi:hypothetical protein